MQTPARPRLVFAALLVLAGAIVLRGGLARAADESPAATAPEPALDAESEAEPDYDPWAPFNERMFSFNHGVLDRFVVKPVAMAWDKICPDPVKRAVGRAIDNLQMPRRLVNNLLQGRVTSAGTEAGRFVINTTVGIAGFMDVAKRIHLSGSEADMGETFGVWGIGTGPYLVLPFMAPLTVRDGFGRAVDSVLDPLWLVPFFGSTAISLVNTVNERSLHLRFFANVEESTLDLYSSVRNGYLQRRRRVVAGRHEELLRALVWEPAPPPAIASPTHADGTGA